MILRQLEGALEGDEGIEHSTKSSEVAGATILRIAMSGPELQHRGIVDQDAPVGRPVLEKL